MAQSETTGQEDIDEKLRVWFEWDRNTVNTSDLKEMVFGHRFDELRAVLLTRLEFGTAGIRGPMGAGFSRINDLVIIQTSQGLVQQVVSSFPLMEDRSVVVGYDGRHNSRRFAELTAVAFIQRGFKVYLFSRMCPTPFVPFAVTHFKCQVGIMITASHNPKEDNGYKVYWDNGAQIISPLDRNIQHNILVNLAPWDNAWDCRLTLGPNVIDPWNTIMETYYRELDKGCLYKDINRKCPVKFTYTAMHGVGHDYMVEAFKTAGFPSFIPVEEQMDPNPEFPTVKFPNPEEGQCALDCAMRTADKFDSYMIIANDPDADRMAVAEKQNNGSWRIFNGNETGALLGWWALYLHKNSRNPAPLSDCVMIASTVSSKILRSMANKEGFQFIETLTGFKWMGNEAYKLRKTKKVLFAFEEAIGFMFGTTVLDKDGISAGVRLAELVAYLAEIGHCLSSKLRLIYEEYGYHVSMNHYFICHDQFKIHTFFTSLRNFEWTTQVGPNYPSEIMGGKYKIVGVRDLTTGYDSNQPNRIATLPVSASSQMVTFTFNNGLVLTIRASGTEPKVKYYTELIGPVHDKNTDNLDRLLEDMVQAVIQEIIRPNMFDFLRQY